MAVALFPSLYLGVPLGALVAIRERRGAAGLFLLMLTIIASDTSQYYTGRAFGRRPLAATISPKKTIEGAIGGLIVGTARPDRRGSLVAGRPRSGLAGRSHPARRLPSSWRASPAISSNRCSSAAPASRTVHRSSPVTAASSIASTRCCLPRLCTSSALQFL